MNIRFISSLTPEDEDRLAPVILRAVGAILDELPLAYTLRIETTNNLVFQHAHTGEERATAADQAMREGPRVGAAIASALRARSSLS